MSSSTSSFSAEIKALVLAIVIIAGFDVHQRYHIANHPGEPALLRNFPKIADDLKAADGTNMILLGNSLTQNGYDMPLLRDLLAAQGDKDVHVEKVALTGSSPIEWYHNFARCFVRRGKTPSAIVINMSPSGISDVLPAGYRVGWLANETDWSDVPEVLYEDLKNFEVGGQYLQARVSALYANRWDIRVGLLYKLVPNVMAGMNWVNAGQIQPKVKHAPAPKTYSILTRMLKMAKDNGARAILVAMPAREPYEIEPRVIELLNEYDGVLIDCRTVPGLTAAGFEDGWHLNPDGGKIFTAYIATQLPSAAKR